ncbi:NAD(P)/FAD-dependent oxidoreductase [Nocardioides soli]|uniref:NADPH-dependent 2,4-dienoyl-CoA reductase/sulfur reductase-like enzyme n=1 Tax=Nocardioides soli TaxID=1036020 RepID=A0A7W4Z0X9_9ACTN|nr:FAD-dependent oxidoreductase [Nocardioides soli]MBB3042288.1 NADPH-dependent 2,4-dienoyl-CoA reductase/sulfur reductase-like enzyme [Nocardioides soli]
MSQGSRIAVLGASVAGVAAAEAVRGAGFEGEVHLYDAQSVRPYDRPPLSKGLLSGTQEVDAIALRSDQDWADLDVDLRLGHAVRAVDADRTVTTDAATTTYDGVVVATGTRPRRAPFHISPEVRSHVLQTSGDALRLRADLGDANDVVIIGGGFVGLEVAAAVVALGKRCTVVEVSELPLGSAVGADVAGFVLDRHRAAGCELRLGARVRDVVPAGRGRAEVRLLDGGAVEADLVVLSIGVEPAADLLAATGLDLSDGVEVDGYCRTDLPGIYACGDVASSYSHLYGRRLRIAHWTTAREQGACAGANLVADLAGHAPAPFLHVPYVWSDQLDLKIQTVGRLLDGATTHVEHRDADSIVVAFRLGDDLVGGATINRARDAMLMRRTLSTALAESSKRVGA